MTEWFITDQQKESMSAEETNRYIALGKKKLGGALVLLSGFVAAGVGACVENPRIGVAGFVTCIAGGIYLDHHDAKAFVIEKSISDKSAESMRPLELFPES